MKRSFWHLIPSSFRRRGGWVIVTIFLRALLNFLGLAMLLPLLLLIIEPEKIHTNTLLNRLFEAGGFTSEQHFIYAILCAIVGVIIGKNLLSILLYKVERNYIYDLYNHLSRQLYIHYFEQGLAFVKKQNSAILSRNVNGVSFAFVAGILRPIASMSCEIILFLLLFGALACYHPMAALCVMGIFVPTLVIYYGLVRRRLQRYGEQENRAQREKARTVVESFRGYTEIELNRAFPLMLKRFDRSMAELIEVQRKNATWGTLPSLFTETGLVIGMALMVIWSLHNGGDEGRLLFGIFAVAALRLLPSVRRLMSDWSTLKYNRYAIDTLLDAHLEESTSREDENPTNEVLPFEQMITFDRITFCFPDAPKEPILSDFSLEIRKGERLGIRGASGVGKTTLFHLLMGFYTPTQGEIRIDQIPLTTANRRSWQNQLGYVSQNVFLSDTTLAANVALGYQEEEIDREQVRKALRAARMEHFIDSLPQGIETPIGECGCRLSGGQRQRIGIARALYHNASVLLFDEATSALDSQTEEEINHSIQALSEANPGLTIIVIAHRESTLDYCDRIIDLSAHD